MAGRQKEERHILLQLILHIYYHRVCPIVFAIYAFWLHAQCHGSKTSASMENSFSRPSAVHRDLARAHDAEIFQSSRTWRMRARIRDKSFSFLKARSPFQAVQACTVPGPAHVAPRIYLPSGFTIMRFYRVFIGEYL